MRDVPANNRNRDREIGWKTSPWDRDGHKIAWCMDNAQIIANRARDNLWAAMLPGIPASDRQDWEHRARLDQAASAKAYASIRAALPFVSSQP